MKLIFLLQIYIIVFLESVTGFVDITLNPPQVVQDVTSTLSLSFSCNVGAANEIREITTLQLSRNGVVLARIFVFDNLSAVYDKSFEQEANSRGFVLDGKVTKTAPSPPTAFITLALNRSKVVCSDQLQYTCHLEYYDQSIKLQLDEQSANLSVYVPPSMVQNALKVYKDGLIIGGGDSKDTASTSFKVGDTVTLECGTSIGSDSTTKIYWKITSELIESTFIDYQPPAGNSTDEVATAGKCEFTRKAKAQYNITSVDANRNYKTLLGFLCYALAFHGGQRHETPTSEKFYINLGSATADGGNTAAVAAAGTSKIGAIVGGVIAALVVIIIIVIVVWIVLFRRNEGSSYTTKEEYGADHPNRAPSIAVTSSEYDAKRSKTKKSDGKNGSGLLKPTPKPHERVHIGPELHYAELNLSDLPTKVPRKSKLDPVEYAEKNEYINYALDAPHETKPRSHHRGNDRGRSRGHHNPAMEQDYDDNEDFHSRDGSPTRTHDTISHMDGTRPIGTGV